ncbi:MAG: multicopper oxidase domain-containing protein [Burkholderiaceae bacterium]|nr:multicopper oxidase domain-containing protein [Burkholderiaceae bacterium]
MPSSWPRTRQRVASSRSGSNSANFSDDDPALSVSICPATIVLACLGAQGYHRRRVPALARNGRARSGTPRGDTTLLAPGDEVDVAFVADNPGEWLQHCHVLEHHAGGMGFQFRVA